MNGLPNPCENMATQAPDICYYNDNATRRLSYLCKFLGLSTSQPFGKCCDSYRLKASQCATSLLATYPPASKCCRKTAKRIFDPELPNRWSPFDVAHGLAKLPIASNWPKQKSVINHGESLSVFLLSRSYLATGTKYTASHENATHVCPKPPFVCIPRTHAPGDMFCSQPILATVPVSAKSNCSANSPDFVFHEKFQRACYESVAAQRESYESSHALADDVPLSIPPALRGGANHGPIHDRIACDRLLQRAIPKTHILQKVPGDGNCLYSALSRALLASNGESVSCQEMRRKIVHAIATEPNLQTTFFDELDLTNFIQAQSVDGTYGDELCIRAFCELYHLQVTVFLPTDPPLKFGNVGAVLSLAFNMKDHFDVVLPKPVSNQSRISHVISVDQPEEPINSTSNSVDRRENPQNPAFPSSVTLLSLNVNSWKVHKNELLHAADLLVLQETRLTLKGQHDETKHITGEKRSCLWGLPCPPVTFKRSGGRVARQASGVGKQGGVGIISCPGLPLVRPALTTQASALLKTQRWIRGAVPMGCKGAGVKRWLHIISLYNFSGRDSLVRTNRERLLEQTLAEASAFGDQATIICMDANCSFASSVAMRLAVSSGKWVDLGSHFTNRSPEPTFSKNKDWNKHDWGRGVTRPDFVLVNQPALQICAGFRLVRDLSPRGHLGLEVSLRLSASLSLCRTIRFPKAFQFPERDNWSAEDKSKLADTLVKKHAQALERARQQGQEHSWRVFSQIAEEYLRHRCAEGIVGEGSRHGQIRYEQKSVAVQVADKKHPDSTGSTQLKACFRALRQAREYGRKLSLRAQIAVNEQDFFDFTTLAKRLHVFIKKKKLRLEVPDLLSPPSHIEKFIIDLHSYVLEVQQIQMDCRIAAWKRRIRSDFWYGGRHAFSWLRDGAQPTVQAIASSTGEVAHCPHDMVEIVRKEWDTLFNQPTWKAFLERFVDYLPTYPCDLQPITTSDVRMQLSRAKKHRAIAADGWRIHEIQDLPDSLLAVATDLFNDLEKGQDWADLNCFAIISCVPKDEQPLQVSDGESKLDLPTPFATRPISNLSPWTTCYSGIRYRHMAAWREQWLPCSMHGGRSAHETGDVSIGLSLQLEAARALEQHVIGIAMDRRKCFDLLPRNICFGILSHQGAPDSVIDAERRFYCQLKSMYKIANTHSACSTRCNGFVQGCSFSLQAVQGLLAVWARFVESTTVVPPLITTSSFLDDSNMRCQATNANDAVLALVKAWARSKEFDKFTGMQTNFQKTVVFANTTDAEKKARKVFCQGNAPLALKRSFLLVGGVITTMGKPAVSYRNKRVSKTIKKIKRSRYAPVSFHQKAHMIAAACLPMAVYGCELQPLTQDQCARLRRAVSAAMSMFKGFTWCRLPVPTVSLILPGHRIDAKQAYIYHVLSLCRRIFTKRPDLRPLFETAWNFVVHRQAQSSGLVASIFQITKLLNYQWVEPWTMVSQEQETFHLLRGVDSKWKHDLREILRSMVFNEDTFRNRKDMQGLTQVAYLPTVSLLQNRKSAKCLTAMQKTHLRTILGGAVQSRERLVLAKLTQSSTCVYCQQTDETVSHIFWECPRWADLRSGLLNKYDNHFLSQLPACTKQCGIISSCIGLSEADACAFAADLQLTFIHILTRRHALRHLQTQEEQIPPAPPNDPGDEEELPELVRRNPGLADNMKLFPTYPWDFDQQSGNRHFQGQVPSNWRRFSNSSEWLYPLDWFPALIWYFRNLNWPPTAEEDAIGITWLELALDFQVSTHCILRLPDEPDDTHAERQARLFAAAAARVATICKGSIAPGLHHNNKQRNNQVYILTSLGLGRASGLQQRPCMMQPGIVHRILFHAALELKFAKNQHSRSFIPDFASLPKPLWSGPGRRRLVGKQATVFDVAPPSAKQFRKSHKATINLVEWSLEEQAELDGARDWRHRTRIQKRLLHNRTAEELNLHVLEPFDVGMPLRCSRCHKTLALGYLAKFVQEKCGGALDINNLPEPGLARKSVKLQQRVDSVEKHNNLADQNATHLVAVPHSLEDVLRCTRPECKAESAHGWRRFHRFAKERCLAV